MAEPGVRPSRMSVTAIDLAADRHAARAFHALPGRMFMGGEPMKVATNRVSGRR